MTDPAADSISAPQRIFLRLPVNLPATVIIDNQPCENVTISDLSSTGISIKTAEDKRLPPIFDLRFRLSFFSTPITARVEIKNRTPAGNSVRIGCIFLEARDEGQELINDYIEKFLNFNFADSLIFTTAFLCFIDVLWKLYARFVNEYYAGTEFGRSAGTYAPSPFSEAAFICYAVLSLAAVLMTAYNTPIKGKPRFMVCITLFMAILAYLSWKNIFCIQYKLWDAGFLIAKAAFWWEVFLGSCVAASIIICLAFLKKISLILRLCASMPTTG